MKLIKIFLLLFIASNAIAQTTDTTTKPSIDSATMYLTGTFKKYNPQRAFQINLQNAANGNGKAMNAVAIQYMKGLGIDSNFNLAVYWFNQAATNNYTKALVNLGMLYKHKANDSIGYSIACDYFNQALQANEPSALFAQGYMLYKGLGCTQSYTAALALFNQGIAINQVSCMYFKGLCFKYGYGVLIDADSANYYINKAALRGYKQANTELYNNNSNTAARGIRNTTTKDEKFIARNEAIFEYSRISKSDKAINLSGEFTGSLNQYDYSGKKLIAQIPIVLQVSTSNNTISGTLQLNKDKPFSIQAIQQGNQLIFSQTALLAKNEATSKRRTRNEKLIFKSANLQLESKNDTNYLTGTLQLFNTYTHEIDKPINIKLQQKNNPIDNTFSIQNSASNITIYPNPNNGNFNISFNLAKPSAVKININNQQGKLVYTKIFEGLQVGKQSVSIPAIQGEAGIYTATIVNNHFKQTTSFIKE